MQHAIRLVCGFRHRRLALLAGGTSLLLLLLVSVLRVALDADLRSWLEEERCLPQRSVCFVKTHKCASSSVQNVLLRYGESHGLRFVLPARANYLGHPRLFNRSMAALGAPPFDLLAHHARFNEAEMRAVLRPGAAFVTIVREPASLFESLYSYYEFRARTHLTLEEVAAAAGNASLAGRVQSLVRNRTGSKLGFNQMSFDLGLEPALFGNASAVRRFVRRVDAAFDLVMVADRINESLVLLRHLLCWDVDDVVVFKHNARQGTFRQSISVTLATQLRALNAADVQLYEHFARRFEQRVEVFGRHRMAEELRLLEERTQYWYSRCVLRTAQTNKVTPTRLKFWISSKAFSDRYPEFPREACFRQAIRLQVHTLHHLV
ncbi:galactosylceramide sulfotransferase-like isoform X2 [Amblyomma americanum]